MTENAECDVKVWQGDDRCLVDFANLLSGVYQREISVAHMQWKHANNPLGPSLIAYARNHQGEMVAARAFWRMFADESPVYQPCDTVTRDDFQRCGLFSRLTQMCLNNIETDAAVVNFPNPNSYPAYLKLGWQKYADNKRVFAYGLKSNQAPIADINTYLTETFSVKRSEYLLWRFSPDSGTAYQFYPHKNGVVVSNGVMQGFISSKASVHAFGKKSGKNTGYVVPTHFNAGLGGLSGAIALPCSSRTVFYLQPQAQKASVDKLFSMAQVNTLMDTF